MTFKNYTIKISLKDSNPKIWRRIKVQSHILLKDFHIVIQATMGWTNSHLHEFIHNDRYYTQRLPDDELWDELGNVDYKDIMVSGFLKKEKEKMVYIYDLGDYWEHEILLEKIEHKIEEEFYPYCLAGKRNCPPEDSGGIFGYSEKLKILSQPKHKEFKNTISWLGKDFDPEYFNTRTTNNVLLLLQIGC